MPGDFANICGSALERKCGVAGGDGQARKYEQIGGTVLADPVYEMLLFPVVAHVDEGEHADGPRRAGFIGFGGTARHIQAIADLCDGLDAEAAPTDSGGELANA